MLRKCSEFNERRFALGISRTFVSDNSKLGDAPMTPHFWKLRDLSGFEQLDQVGTRNVEKIGRLLSRKRTIVHNDAHQFTSQEQVCSLFNDTRQ